MILLCFGVIQRINSWNFIKILRWDNIICQVHHCNNIHIQITHMPHYSDWLSHLVWDLWSQEDHIMQGCYKYLLELKCLHAFCVGSMMRYIVEGICSNAVWMFLIRMTCWGSWSTRWTPPEMTSSTSRRDY